MRRSAAFRLPMASEAGHSSCHDPRMTLLLLLVIGRQRRPRRSSSRSGFSDLGGVSRDRALLRHRRALSAPRAERRAGLRVDRLLAGAGVRGQVHFRLSRAEARRIGGAAQDRRPDLPAARRRRATPGRPIGGADADIVSAMRTGIDMSVETRSASGALVRDTIGCAAPPPRSTPPPSPAPAGR